MATVKEILVHLSAPSSRQDDEQSRAFAAAYSGFEAARMVPLGSISWPANADSQNAASIPPHEPTPAAPEAVPASQTTPSEAPCQVPRTSDEPRPGSRPAPKTNQDGAAQTLPAMEYIEDTPLATALLESQLLSSSLAAALEDEIASPLEARPSKQRRPAPAPHEQSASPQPSQPDPESAAVTFADEILPPSPPAALASPPETHVTPTLTALASNPLLSSVYQPRTQVRVPRPLERGYWRVETRDWVARVQAEFWACLEQVVGGGGAGWGVMAFREEAEVDRNSAEEERSGAWVVEESGGTSAAKHSKRNVESRTELGTVRIYCWGEVLEHVYLLVYVASQSKVKRTGAEWIDADGRVVISMGRRGDVTTTSTKAQQE